MVNPSWSNVAENLGYDPARLARAAAWIARWGAEPQAPALGAVVGSSAGVSPALLAGSQTARGDAQPVRDDALFLIASPTKPIVGLALLMLAEEGELQLLDPVARFVPEFAQAGKRSLTLAHCLTHTSGLPDMLPENAELRATGAPLSRFLELTCALKPEFRPGHGVRYQSMGYLMLGEVIARVTGEPLPEFLRRRIFAPLAMHDTSLGRATEQERIAEIRMDGLRLSGATSWNEPYWRALGAPWGGVVSSPADLGKLCQHLLQIHRGEPGIVCRATVEAMGSNQLARMPDVPEANRRALPWGYGWQMNWPADATTFGDLLSPAAYGHWGATGTLVWLDPARDRFAVLLSTQHLDLGRRRHSQFSNLVCAAIV